MARGSLSTDDLAGREAGPDPRDPDRSELDERDQGRYEVDERDQGRHDERDDRPEPRHGDPSDEPRQEQYAPLLEDREAGVFLDRWRDVQARFVDDPQAAVRDGDALVAELMQALAQRFSEQKGALQQHWDDGSEPETEQLRRALQEYRSFFERLLST